MKMRSRLPIFASSVVPTGCRVRSGLTVHCVGVTEEVYWTLFQARPSQEATLEAGGRRKNTVASGERRGTGDRSQRS